MDELKLVTPAPEHEAAAFAYLAEFREHDSQIHGVGGLDRYDDYSQWLEKLAEDRDWEHTTPNRVPADTYFLMRREDSRPLGMINIRHQLNDFLLREGGHIGYSIRPTERRKGYAAAMLAMALERCRELGLKRVLITCDKGNIGSARTIQKNGGVLENEITGSHLADVLQRYWIELS